MKIKKNLLISSITIVLLTVPLLPYSYSDGFKFKFGYPLAYFTTFNLPPINRKQILLMRIHMDIMIFFIDVVLVYLLFTLVAFFINKLREKRE
ncbi:hypothetical protein OW763_10780 [Clostridium aestuarii]|uniref:DUF4306 domain-containing protein n=1 Tax=Clostridium aestuarii TaxID=338193 RepID=A0ABT4D3Q4_9CLOT|nr:hypothetical protein [Clostridium aestuarii]MCY6484825.1 hypothetical protein [Clostridium aestuarii]